MKLLLAFFTALLLSVGIAWAPPLITGVPYALGVGWNGLYTISAVTPTTYTYATGTPSSTVIGTAVAATSPQPFVGSYSLSGANAADFTINSSTGAISTNGSTPTCGSLTPITSINVVATQSGAAGSPFTQAITINCNLVQPPFDNEEINSFAVGNNGNGDSGTVFQLKSMNVLHPSSTFVLAVTYLRSVATLTGASITDTSGTTWSNPVCTIDANNGTNSDKTSLFVQNLGNFTGLEIVTVNTGGTAHQPFHYKAAVKENLLNPAADGSKCVTVTPTSGGLIDPGSFTPTTTNTPHIIWNYTALNVCCSSLLVPTQWTPASGFTLHASSITQQYNLNTMFPWAGEWESVAAQTPTNSPVDASITATGETNSTGDLFNSVTVALAVNAYGANVPNPAIHVVKIVREMVSNWSSGTTITFQESFSGNLRVLTGGFTVCTTGCDWNDATVTSSDGCVWTGVFDNADSTGFWYAQNCSPDLNDTVTFTGTAAHTQNGYIFWDVANASASSYQNHTAGTQVCAVNATGTPSFNPSVSSGLTILNFVNGNGPTPSFYGSVPLGASYDFMTYPQMSDNSWDSQGNAIAHVNFSTNATQTWGFSLGNGSQSCWYVAAAFN